MIGIDELPPHLRNAIESVPPWVRHATADLTVGTLWRTTRSLNLEPWAGPDRLGLCSYVPRLTISIQSPTRDRIEAGCRLRLVAIYDADEAAVGAGITDLATFYEWADSADHLTFEVLDGELAGRLVQAMLDPVSAHDASLATATLEQEAGDRTCDRKGSPI